MNYYINEDVIIYFDARQIKCYIMKSLENDYKDVI